MWSEVKWWRLKRLDNDKKKSWKSVPCTTMTWIDSNSIYLKQFHLACGSTASMGKILHCWNSLFMFMNYEYCDCPFHYHFLRTTFRLLFKQTSTEPSVIPKVVLDFIVVFILNSISQVMTYLKKWYLYNHCVIIFETFLLYF